MTGRASLIVILGFSLIIGRLTQYWTYASGRAVQNAVNYYSTSRSHNGAVIAANLACDSIFQNNGDTLSINGLKGTFPDGSHYAIASVMQQGVGKSRNCFITATATDTDVYNNYYNDTVRVLLSPYSFSRFAWFTGTENGVNWTTGDTLTGPLQTNGNMYVNGRPFIKGPVTIGGKLYNRNSVALTPTNLSTWESSGDTLHDNSFRSGVTDSLPSTFDSSYTFCDTTRVYSTSNNTGSSYAYDVYLTFDTLGPGGTGRITETDTTRQYNSGTWTTVAKSKDSTYSVSSITNAKTGEAMILVKDGDVHVSGIVNGDVTVLAAQPSTNSRRSSSTQSATTVYFNSSVDGNVLISSSIKYKDKNAMNDNGTDMLGLVGTNSVMVTAQSGNTTIDAAIFALKGSFTYQNYQQTGLPGYLYVNGSIIQNVRGAVSSISNGVVTEGFKKDYTYDGRYRYLSPPGFPLARQFEVISWWE